MDRIAKTEIDPFWRWVCARKAHNNPRGDFIRDTRDLIRRGIDPATQEAEMCWEAEREYERLRRAYVVSEG